MIPLVMLDLCSGLGGAHQAMAERNWTVYSVDCLEWLRPTIVADVKALPLRPFPVDLLWASPTCTDYSRYHLPWYPNEPEPDLSLFHACQTIIQEWEPRYWVIENVQGAVRFHGRPTYRFGSRLLWTNIPMIGQAPLLPSSMATPGNRRKRSVWGQDPLAYWKRSKIPYALAEAVAATVEGLTNR